MCCCNPVSASPQVRTPVTGETEASIGTNSSTEHSSSSHGHPGEDVPTSAADIQQHVCHQPCKGDGSEKLLTAEPAAVDSSPEHGERISPQHWQSDLQQGTTPPQAQPPPTSQGKPQMAVTTQPSKPKHRRQRSGLHRESSFAIVQYKARTLRPMVVGLQDRLRVMQIATMHENTHDRYGQREMHSACSVYELNDQ